MQAFDELLTVEQLSFSYEEDEKPVFQDISFELQKGECVLLLGPSGCGKSSLALCLNVYIRRLATAFSPDMYFYFKSRSQMLKPPKRLLSMPGSFFRILISSSAC